MPCKAEKEGDTTKCEFKEILLGEKKEINSDGEIVVIRTCLHSCGNSCIEPSVESSYYLDHFGDNLPF